jgi:mannose-6-phosphate isomerase-like protein (cupin superfamily)
MRTVKWLLGFAFVVTMTIALVSADQNPAQGGAARGGAARGGGGGPVDQLAWAPKAVKPGGWTGVHKPHTKLTDVLAKHKGQNDWVETIVDDDTLHGEYIAMSPGKKTPKRMNADTREWWIVQDGQLRFTIDGQQPFVASKGYLVQVPYRTFYTMETIGEKPSLRYEVNIARARKMYAMEETPVPMEGVKYLPIRIPGRGEYAEGNKPFVDFNAVAAGTDKTRRFVNDDRAVANIIIGPGIPPPPASEKGHFHEESSEFWFILLNKIRYTIEGLDTFVADQGDIVYVPKQRWHLASFAGEGPSCRLAMNGYTDLGHSFETVREAAAGNSAGGR